MRVNPLKNSMKGKQQACLSKLFLHLTLFYNWCSLVFFGSLNLTQWPLRFREYCFYEQNRILHYIWFTVPKKASFASLSKKEVDRSKVCCIYEKRLII